MSSIDTIWYTRCPVPTGSGLAHGRGELAPALASGGPRFGVLQDAGPELADRHYDHRLPGLIREGGNVPALAARSAGTPTRLIGLTWIEEWQSILVRRETPVTEAAALRGARVALPGWAATRAKSFPRAMALHGIKGALAQGGLTLDDVTFVEVPPGGPPSGERRSRWPGLDALVRGEVDAVYAKGARAAEQAAGLGLVVAVDLDAHPDPRTRVNNGTPRPITVHQRLLDERPGLVVAFLEQTLRAADWAAGDLDGVRRILAAETSSAPDAVVTAYRNGFHRGLHPDLSGERLELLRVQKDFLLTHGFLDADVDLDSWVADEPLRRARERLAGRAVA